MQPVPSRTTHKFGHKLGRKLGWWGATIVLALIGSYIAGTPKAVTRASARQHRQTANGAAPSRVNPQARAQLAGEYGRLPLSFEANQGQTDPQVKFLARGRGYGLFLTPDEAVLELQGSRARGLGQGRSETRSSFARHSSLVTRHSSGTGDAVLTMKLVGANPNANVSGTDELPGKANYFIGNDPARWRANVPTYGRVVYQNVYPGVDLAYYGNQGRLEYDFVVAPGANPKAIRLDVGAGLAPPSRARPGARAQQAAPLRIAPNGDLLVTTRGGDVVLNKPVVYQPDAVTPVSGSSLVARHSSLVEGRYRLVGRNQVSFEIASYDPRRPLVIDPVLSYSTFLSGAMITSANGIAVDASGNAFVTGETTATNFPVTPGAFQDSFHGVQDAFVTKLNPTGTALDYSTYLGGDLGPAGMPNMGSQDSFGIAVDSSGDAYVTGDTNSTDFPTTAGVRQTTLKGGFDAYVTKLSADGSSLVYSTYLGGTMDDFGNAIAVDSSGDAYVVGQTLSTDFPVTMSGFQGTNNHAVGLFDAFFSELNPTATAPANMPSGLIYGTYLGGMLTGTGNDIAHSITIDSSGNAYVAGETTSTDFPTTSGVAQSASGGSDDAFVAEFNPTLSGAASLVYSTYLGGTGADIAYGIALQPGCSSGACNAYVTGVTASTNFPVTSGVLGGTFQSGSAGEAFVTQVNAAGSAFVYSTYLGGNVFDRAFGVAVDASGDAFVTGNTLSPNFPIVMPVQATCSGTCDDAFVTELNPNATALVYSTFLGGSSHDQGDALALDISANAYVAGFTNSADFPTTPGAFQPGCSITPCAAAMVFKLGPPAPGAQVQPSVLSFGDQLLKTTSAPQTTTLTNSGAAPLANISISITGTDPADFAQTNTCPVSPATLGVGSQCTITVTFTPTATGARSGTVTITDNAPNSPQSVSLTGTGTVPVVTLSVTSLTFSQSVGATSAPKSLALLNSGGAPLTITSIAVMSSPPYTETNNCGSSVAAGASCAINVTFAPTKSGSANGTLTITDNAANSPQTVTLTGTGVASAVTLAPASLNFLSVNIGVTSAAQSVTVTNSGNATLSAINITLAGTNAGDFKISANTCGTSVAAGGSCTLMVTFTPLPSTTASRSATISITDNAPDSPETVALSGMGADFSTAASPPSASVSAGQSATFSLTEAPIGGFNSAVMLACTAPTGFLGSCTISPASVTPSGTTAGMATVTVSTLAPSGLVPGSGPRRLLPGPGGLLRLPWFVWLLGLSALALAAQQRKRRLWLALAATMLFVILGVSCGSSTSSTVSPGTLPGTYTFTITGTSNSLAHSTTVAVTVTDG